MFLNKECWVHQRARGDKVGKGREGNLVEVTRVMGGWISVALDVVEWRLEEWFGGWRVGGVCVFITVRG